MKFKVGEIAISIGIVTGIRRECEIIATPESSTWVSENGKTVAPGNYLIRAPGHTNSYGGDMFQAEEAYLRKRIDPQMPDEVRAWFDVPVKTKAPA